MVRESLIVFTVGRAMGLCDYALLCRKWRPRFLSSGLLYLTETTFSSSCLFGTNDFNGVLSWRYCILGISCLGGQWSGASRGGCSMFAGTEYFCMSWRRRCVTLCLPCRLLCTYRL